MEKYRQVFMDMKNEISVEIKRVAMMEQSKEKSDLLAKLNWQYEAIADFYSRMAIDNQKL